ncbi:hypothetical protein HDV05_007499 [Chytridiales sp. JEL 0842]|nr:hypothetical protein HDV05_007499 [Chytridiales sp. JEL 0842]
MMFPIRPRSALLRLPRPFIPFTPRPKSTNVSAAISVASLTTRSSTRNNHTSSNRSYWKTAIAGTGLVGATLLTYNLLLLSNTDETLCEPAFDPSASSLRYETIDNEKIPVAEIFGADSDKPKLVILGTGWASTGILKTLKADGWDTVVVSPTNYFLFTPLLPEATSGTVEARSLMESARKICKRSGAKYLEAEAQDVHFDKNYVQVQSKSGQKFLVKYDKLVISVGAMNSTMGVPGVSENTHYLKTINDARALRYKIVSLCEEAALPTVSDEERKRLLTFVIAGGGPTGVEFAAELHDFVKEDLATYYPNLPVNLTVVQGSDHILNTYAKSISEMAEKQFQRNNINILFNARVVAVEPNKLVYKLKNVPKGEKDTFEIPFGLCVWSTGVGMRPFTERLSKKLASQTKSRALVTDTHLQLKGVSDVYALGDCATIDNKKVLNVIMDKFQSIGRSVLSKNEFVEVAKECRKEYPQTEVLFQEPAKMFDTYDIDKSGSLELSEIESLIKDVDKNLTSLPATAQVAAQEGEYLGKKLNEFAKVPRSQWADFEAGHLKPFRYHHFGSFSYIGSDNAVVELGNESLYANLYFLLAMKKYIFWRWLSFRDERTAYLWLAPYDIGVLSIWINYILGCNTNPGSVPADYDPTKETSASTGQVKVKELKKSTGKPRCGAFYFTPPASNTEVLFIIIDSVLLFILLFTVGVLSGFQLYYTMSNTTTIESSENTKIDELVRRKKISSVERYPYDLGVTENLKAVLGRRVWLWWLPQRAEGDGIHFKVNPELAASGKEITWPPMEYYKYKTNYTTDDEEESGDDAVGEEGVAAHEKEAGRRFGRHVRRGSEGYLVKDLSYAERERLIAAAIDGYENESGEEDSEENIVDDDTDEDSDNETLLAKKIRYEGREDNKKIV